VKSSAVKEYAVSQGIDILQPTKIKAQDAVGELKKYDADIYVVAAYGQLLSEEILNIPRFGCINIHASLLPRYRGAAPIQRAIIEGEKETGITIMQMDKGLDTGDILLTEAISLDEKEISDTLHEKLSELGAELIIKALAKIEKNEIIRIKQNDNDSSYAPMLGREEGLISWNRKAVEIERLIRGLNSKPGAYTYYNNKKMKICAADVIFPAGEEDKKFGTIISVTKSSIVVKCGEGALSITELQLEGKKKMSVKDFLLGYKIDIDVILA
ncbi:MAG: methionyl-tRNA formyltransferase, partial [Lachnospiraceae bacterium]|nr:methionyl-tRNA formyltransferase [Lachnospiraceae bacterium]